MFSHADYYDKNIINLATRHRVRNCSTQQRYSWPYFFEPTWTAELARIDDFKKFVEEDNRLVGPIKKAEYEDAITYGDYVTAKYNSWFDE